MPKTRRLKAGKNRTLGKGHRFDDINVILVAARACFERYGVQKTRLEDVAQEAGISRALIYKFFQDRQALNDAMVNYELKRVGKLQKKKMELLSNFRDVLVEGAILGIKLAREDSILMDLLVHSSIEYLPDLLLDKSNIAHTQTLEMWQPYFAKARASGELKRDLDDHDLMEWLMSVQYMFLMRDNINYDRIRELLRMFLCPAVLPKP